MSKCPVAQPAWQAAPEAITLNSWVAEGACVGGPFSKADRDHVGYDTADIDFLGRIVVGAGMVASDCHRPGRVTGMQACKEAGGVVDILVRVEHVVHAAEVFCVVVVVDLHATKVNQLLALLLSSSKRGKGLAAASREDSLSLYIQGVRLQAALFPRFSKANRVKDSSRNAVSVRGPQDFSFTGVGRCAGFYLESTR